MTRYFIFYIIAIFFICIFFLPSGYAATTTASGSMDLTKQMHQTQSIDIVERVISFGGIFILLGIAWLWNFLFIKKTKQISWAPVIWGVILQIVFGLIVLNPHLSFLFFNIVDKGVHKLLSFSEEGAKFVFGNLVLAPGQKGALGFFFFFNVLPTIIFFSSLMTLLYHLNVMQWIVKFFAIVMQKTMKTSGSETLSAAANIFVGQTEAPLVVKPFIESMTKSELHAIMVGGFATVAGGVMAAYVKFLGNIPGIAGHLVIASIMSAPAALAVSKVIFPETEDSVTKGDLKMVIEKPDANSIEAAARGASEGMTLVLNVAAMLMAFVGLIALINYILHFAGLSLEMILGYVFKPIAFVMGVPWKESGIVGQLLGEKLVLTEFIAYLHLGDILSKTPGVLSVRSAIIASYALCGFANFASIGIQIGGIGGIAPSRRGDLAKLGMSAMIGGAIAACMTGTIAGILI